MNNWTQAEAIKLCVLIENICPHYGCHVALTGGLLYKHGVRKDCDLLFYRIRQLDDIDYDGLFEALSKIGFQKVSGYGWCIKARYENKSVDCFFPEEIDNSDAYPPVVAAEPSDKSEAICEALLPETCEGKREP